MRLTCILAGASLLRNDLPRVRPLQDRGSRTQLLVSTGPHPMAETRWQPGMMSPNKGLDTIPGKQISYSTARHRRQWSGPRSARFSRAERGAVQAAAVATAGFCGYGFATG